MDNKRYHTLHYDNLQTFGCRVFKASLDAGCGCPNRDGSLGTGGCVFCDQGSRYFAGTGDIAEQLQAERRRIRRKWPEAKLIAYFQAGTNTYGALDRLLRGWETVLRCPDVVGVSIATRADCLGAPVLEALETLARQTRLTVELGLQTVHDATARRIGRGYDFEGFLAGFLALRQRGIRICVHIIDGLPGEGRSEMLETAKILGRLRPEGVKIHLLHVNEDTPMASMWRQGRYIPLERDAYVDILTEQLRWFPPETVIERLTGDGDKRRLLAPLWSRDKIAVLGAIDKAMAEKRICQGDRYGDEK